MYFTPIGGQMTPLCCTAMKPNRAKRVHSGDSDLNAGTTTDDVPTEKPWTATPRQKGRATSKRGRIMILEINSYENVDDEA